jgi:hypothetical protein
MSRGDVTSGGWGSYVLQRLVLPGFLALLFLTTLCMAPSPVARADTTQACHAGVDDAGLHARIRTHHAVPRCPEGEGFTEHNRRKQPIGSGANNASNLKFAGLSGDAVEAPSRAFDFAAVTEDGRRVAGNVPHSYDPQGPPVRTL